MGFLKVQRRLEMFLRWLKVLGLVLRQIQDGRRLKTKCCISENAAARLNNNVCVYYGISGSTESIGNVFGVAQDFPMSVSLVLSQIQDGRHLKTEYGTSRDSIARL
jgi:hypothetical protein